MESAEYELTVPVTFRATRAEREDLHRRARADGYDSLSNWLRARAWGDDDHNPPRGRPVTRPKTQDRLPMTKTA